MNLKISRKKKVSAEALESRTMLNAPGVGWTLTFDDEFNGTSLDTTKWANYLPWSDGSTGNNQWEGSPYLDYMVNANTTISGVNLTSNLSVSGGELHLKTQQTSSFTVGSQSFTYTGAMITTGLNPYRSFSSGYFEIRARVPQGAGNWPAFWMTNGWPPEDDIMEYKPSGGPWNHQGLYGMDGNWHDNTTTGSNVPAAGWHTYALEWGNGVQTFFIDGQQTYQTSTGVPGSANPEYLLLNSGIYSGQQGGYSNSNDNTLDVDYVRIYTFNPTTSPGLINAGMEASNSGFTSSSSYGAFSMSTTNPYTGDYDLKIAGYGAGQETVTGLSPNTTYTFSAYGYSTVSGTYGLIGVKNFGGTETSTPFAQTSWGEDQVTFTTGSTNTSALLYLYNPSTTVTTYYDDASLELTPTITVSPLSNVTVSSPVTIPITVNETGSGVIDTTVTASSSNSSVVSSAGLAVGGTQSNPTLTVTPQASASGSATITVDATDPYGVTAVQTFIVTVLASATINGDVGGTVQNDVFKLVRSGASLNLYENNTTNTPTQTFTYANVGTIFVNGLGGNNQLTLDYSGGDPVPAGGVNFNGGSGTNTLIVTAMPGTESANLSNGSLVIGADNIAFTNTANLNLDLGPGSSTLFSTTPVLASVLLLSVDAGATLALAASSTLPSNSILNIDGTLKLNNQSATVDQITGTGTLSTGTSATTLVVGAGNGNSAFSGSIIGSAGLTKYGTGTFILSGTDSFTGPVNLGGGATSGGNVDGILQITTAAALAGVTQVNFKDNNNAYAELQLNSSTGIALPVTLSFLLDANSDGAGGTAATLIDSLAGNNVINGAMSFTVGGAGYGISVDSGSLAFTDGQTVTSHAIFLRGAGSGSFSLGLAGTASITVSGPGSWTLNGNNTYSGYTNVSGGTLTLAPGSSLASTSLAVSAGGTFNVSGIVPAIAALTANGTVNFSASTNSAILVRKLASLSIGSAGIVTLASATNHQYRTLLVPGTLTFASNTGKLDLGNNDLDAPGASLSTLFGLIAQGFNNGTWTGTGITSSAAAGDPTHLTALGILVNNTSGGQLYGSGASLGVFDTINPGATDVLIKYTYYGDANLDGRVDGSDYSLEDSGYLAHATGWYNGEFDYGGPVDGSDYTLIDNTFNTQGNNLSSAAIIAAPAALIAKPTFASSFIIADNHDKDRVMIRRIAESLDILH